MTRLIDIPTGELAAVDGEVELVSNAIGSCIAIVLLDTAQGGAGLAHVMLPGRAPAECEEPNRYAEDAIEELLRRMQEQGAEPAACVACVAGGGNVLKRPHDTICGQNCASVRSVLQRKRIDIVAASLGGEQRRAITVHVATGDVYLRIGGRPARLFFSMRTAS